MSAKDTMRKPSLMSETTVHAMTRSVSTFIMNRSIIEDVSRDIRVGLVNVLKNHSIQVMMK